MARNPGTARLVLALALAVGIGGTPRAEAQSLGTFQWQLQPYCNLVSVTVTQNGGLYTLDGYDDQCGAPTRASVVGTAIPNPNGTITLGFTIVTTPDGTPVHVQTALSLATLGGPWSDSAGHTGTLVFTPGAGTGGAPRPAPITTLAPGSITSTTILDGTIAAADVNTSEVQRRVASACPAGQLMTAVNQDGSVVCEAVTASTGGDITAVTAGPGLSGGGASGAVTLGIAPGGVTSAQIAANAVDASKILDGAVALSDINAAQVQVTGTCPAGQAMRTVTQTGAVTCEPVAGGAGDITAVTAGAGLAGGATTGDAALSVLFGGSGVAANAARSDHTHAGTIVTNTGVGSGALGAVTSGDGNSALGRMALSTTTTGQQNTAAGWFALETNITGHNNSAFGVSALRNGAANLQNVAVGTRAAFNGGTANVAAGFEALSNADAAGTTGNTALGYHALFDADDDNNTAVGHDALSLLNTGTFNTAVGKSAVDALTTGAQNVGLGGNTLGSLASGDGNVAVGYTAGFLLLNGSNNLYLNNPGANAESNTMRLGNATHTRAFAAGVRGVTTGNNNALAVVIDSAGQLGTVSSSRRTKTDIADLDPAVTAAVQRLRPVQFRYVKPFADGAMPLQYGLIAEEVDGVLPDLVAYDDAGQPVSVKYHVLPSLLLAEVQRLEQARATQAADIARLRDVVARLETMVAVMAEAAARR
jgi:Chaperone of endosialidase